MRRSEIIHIKTSDAEARFTLAELCDSTDCCADFVFELIDEGIVTPAKTATQSLSFDQQALQRLRLAKRLQHDLQLDLQGVAISLELLEEVRYLRQEVRRLKAIVARHE